MIRKIMLACGILAPLLYVGSDILAAISWEGYSYTAQTVSELRAIGAPTRSFLLPILFLYSLLELIFGIGVWETSAQKRALRITGGLLVGLGLLDLMGPFFHLNLNEAAGSFTNIMHVVITLVTVLCILLIIGFGAAADGKWFRVYSIVTLLVVIATGVWSFLELPQIAAGLPTPWLGVRERINIYGYMLWMMVLAIVLLRTPSYATQDSSTGRSNSGGVDTLPTNQLTKA